jgi:hypothetical protein
MHFQFASHFFQSAITHDVVSVKDRPRLWPLISMASFSENPASIMLVMPFA